MSRPSGVRRPLSSHSAERTMRFLEVGVGVLAAAAAVLLGFLR